MSVAAARKRRAGIQNTPVGPPGVPPPGMNQQPAPPQGGLTLQQVINVINGRLLSLENAEKERASNPSVGPASENSEPLKDGEIELPIGEILSEYAERFELLTQELADLKDVVLKLQSYTMDVNRTLLEERLSLSFTPAEIPDTDELDTAELVETPATDPVGQTLSIQTEDLPSPTVDAPLAPVAVGLTGKGGKKSVSIAGV